MDLSVNEFEGMLVKLYVAKARSSVCSSPKRLHHIMMRILKYEDFRKLIPIQFKAYGLQKQSKCGRYYTGSSMKLHMSLSRVRNWSL